ncbi:hypothetical protein PRIC1_011829 [Phytophthora ramorum]
MMAKFSPCSRSRCAILLAIFALLTCVGAVSVASESNVIKPKMLDRAQGHQLRGFQGKRSLRTFVEITKDDDDSEERAISEFAKKMAQAAKNKLTSNNQATTNKLFKNLQVEETGKELFQSAQFEKWAIKVAKNFKKNPEKAPTSMASTLVSHYGDAALAALLVTAKQNYQSRIVAIQLQKAQLQNWESAGKTGDDIFKLLKLNGKGEELFETPLAPVWMSYVTQLNKANPGEVIFSSLKKLYSDEVLAKMIVGAKNSASTIVMADKLEQVQLSKWMSEGKTIDDIFKLFKLNKEGEKLYQSPMFDTWVSYFMLKSSASTPSKLQEEIWRNQGKTADDIFKLLKLRNSGKKMFSTVDLSTWISYVTRLNQFSKKPDEFIVILELEKQFTGAGLARMLADAKYQASLIKAEGAAETLAGKLQALQFKKWLKQGVTPDSITKEFTFVLIDSTDVKILLAYSEYYTLNVGKVNA